ncbi:MAG: helix-turn-helix domain-containing protein [Rothia dentocariosa]|uniref:helix-turn-helix domain-containing protein n=1 Tax=Rothia dentocariosa TaxID=2047 RepID=UPI00204DEDFF|nr:MAG TPA: helix-turn-helix domain protein [Caudoviricetes sp.]
MNEYERVLYTTRLVLKHQRKTQEQLAEHLGVSLITVNRHLNGKKSFSLKHFCEVAQFLNTTPSELFRGFESEALKE